MLNSERKQQIIRNITSNGWKAVILDIDGTLFPKTSANRFIFSKLKALEMMERFEHDYTSGRLDNDQVATALAAHFKGFRFADLAATLDHTAFIDDATELSTALRAAGLQVLVATVTWRFVAEWVASQLHGEAISGVDLEEQDGILTGNVERHAFDRDKTESLNRWCRTHHIKPQECIAVGDSRSDVHLFGNVGLSLAINPSAGAAEAATFAGDFDTLWELFAQAPLGGR